MIARGFRIFRRWLTATLLDREKRDREKARETERERERERERDTLSEYIDESE
jgi:hypothetical protein